MVDYREMREDNDCNMIAVVLQPAEEKPYHGTMIFVLNSRIFIKRKNITTAADGAQDLWFFRI